MGKRQRTQIACDLASLGKAESCWHLPHHHPLETCGGSLDRILPALLGSCCQRKNARLQVSLLLAQLLISQPEKIRD
jgi:hypothetical protein